jgi:hypothetical protein
VLVHDALDPCMQFGKAFCLVVEGYDDRYIHRVSLLVVELV